METRFISLEQIMPFATAGELIAQNAQPVVSVSPDSGAGHAAQVMRLNDIGFLPVLDDGKLVGVISERDLVRGVHMERPTFVSELMRTRVHAVGPQAKVPECLEIMQRERIRHLPVVDGGGCVLGILSIRDLTGTLIERHERLLRKLAEERVMLL
ncbi:MAG TPA: CBS domain-containing protein, partial [Usitatibacter sp.]|nr:CBS domain-containing protein [Usitatibacter sp.]